MSERARVARLAACLFLAILLAGVPSVVPADDDAATGDPPAGTAGDPPVGTADEPPATAADEPPLPPASPGPPVGLPPLGPGIAGEGHVPPAQPAIEVAGGEEPELTLPPKNLRTIPTAEAAGILGKKVTGAAGEDIGMVVDVLVDGAGKPRAAVIDFGGFLGVGTRKIAVDWAFLQFRPGDRNSPVLLDVTADAIRAAPEYRPSDAETSVVVSPPREDDEGTGAPADAGTGDPAAGKPATGAAPVPEGRERAEPPPPSVEAPGQPPLPEMKPPEGRPKVPPPAAGLPSADDLGPAPAPALPQIPPDARQ